MHVESYIVTKHSVEELKSIYMTHGLPKDIVFSPQLHSFQLEMKWDQMLLHVSLSSRLRQRS